jgi:hypothetical protein
VLWRLLMLAFFEFNLLNWYNIFRSTRSALKQFRESMRIRCGHTHKRYFKIEQHLARHFVYYVERLSSLPPFLYIQIIIPFRISTISTKPRVGILAKCETLMLPFLF